MHKRKYIDIDMIRRHANNSVPFCFEKKSVKYEKGKNDVTYFFIRSSEVSNTSSAFTIITKAYESLK